MARAAAGTVLAGKYTLVELLGQGGMGSVWRAEHVQLRSPVAIKLIEPEIAQNPEALTRFLREAQAAAALRSPHVVQVLDFGADRGVPYIAMELLDGESLAARLQRVRHLSPSETARVVTQVSRAIAKAHESGIIHRDLKPANIVIVQNDEEEVTKVVDFGIAKASSTKLSAAADTRTGAILGTPYYMSPEQAEGERQIDHRTDLWALGVIAFECLLGRKPFDSDALGSLLLAICARPMPVPSSYGRVPPGFDAWFSRACSRDPSLRFSTARELAAELRAVCGETEREVVDTSRPSNDTLPAVNGTTPFAAPTTSPYATSIGLERARGSKLPRLAAAALATLAVALGVAFVARQRAATPAADERARVPDGASPSATRAGAVPAAETVVTITLAQPPPSAPSPAPSASVASPAGRPLAPPQRPARVTPRAKAAPQSAASPPPAATTPPAPKAGPKPVNLGI